MSLVQRLAQKGWIDYWRMFQRYHRYSIEGLEQLDSHRAMLVAGYHGRPIALDMCMFTVAFYDRYGYLPHGVVHRGLESFPPLKSFTDALGFVTDDGPEVERAIERGEHIVVTPGGGQEGCRSFRERYTVAWQGRFGYVRLAAKYGLPIVPVGGAGADDTYIGLNNAEALGRRLGIPRRWAFALWIGFGPMGLYPFSPPFPVRIRQFVGEPIDPWEGKPRPNASPAMLEDVHERVVDALQGVLDRARAWQDGK
jgi:Diacylglycerol acyltransferase